jgi:hypothetical protein
MNQDETAAPIDVEEQSQSGQIAETSTPSTDDALFPGVKVLQTDDIEDGVVFIVNSSKAGDRANLVCCPCSLRISERLSAVPGYTNYNFSHSSIRDEISSVP